MHRSIMELESLGVVLKHQKRSRRSFEKFFQRFAELFLEFNVCVCSVVEELVRSLLRLFEAAYELLNLQKCRVLESLCLSDAELHGEND